MANILVYPYLSPRIIEILAPDTEISVQELVDLCRDWEDEDGNMPFEFLISAAGKEPLGGGVSVGITATLNNAQVIFQPRSVPRDTGVGRTCDATDTNGRQLYVDDADFITDGVQRGDLVYNTTTQSSATILEVVDQYTIKHLELSGGTSPDWTSGDGYVVFEVEQCNISGGNLVAKDDLGADISPLLQTFGVQAVRTSSSSATLQNLAAIQHASYEGGVRLDEANITGNAQSGIDFPIGTLQAPSDNLTDAGNILINEGLNSMFVIGNTTLGTEHSWERREFVGESANKSMINLLPAANVAYCEFRDFTVTGTLDGNSLIERSVLNNLSYVEGFVHQCAIASGSTITLGTGTIANFLQCYSGEPGPTTPTIDCGSTGIISMRDYYGGIKFTNYSGSGAHSIDISSGQVILDSSTIIGGTWVVRGVGKLIDEVGTPILSGTWNGTVTIINELLTSTSMTGVWTEQEKQEALAWSRKASDYSEQTHLKLK